MPSVGFDRTSDYAKAPRPGVAARSHLKSTLALESKRCCGQQHLSPSLCLHSLPTSSLTKINDKVVVDYTEPASQEAFSKDFERRLGNGTFAFQAHDSKSKVYFKNVKVKRLP